MRISLCLAAGVASIARSPGCTQRSKSIVVNRKKEGFVFQDYINFKPEKKITPLDSLPLLFEMGNLIEVSQIENENIQVFLPKQ